ncbi:galactoside O-acetyltransferase [Colletotrichum higginsianum]|uniref:Galactoside O-acetyltransferase n=1 Tax=Colletotrichum higginsianum (strain IMI 349063) TaxID=759273 RepID=H1W065_COLHI|nr:Galactoside O-acetyltransferase [Colletotrichum higginsianum IMI 349063]OBR04286.1 Galactoside O-acetyltransferase [Colletotrichum higginsianum IMI 349063]GJD03349.1 galactoside O-acetyltransferase [Colletotrichum higginsianum]CCF45877.1 galactoside O-acetyltransferase [Colletotrichum higginsianum]
MVPPVRTAKDENAIAHARTLERVPWCDDYEKMVSGMLYSCMAPELVASRNRARRLAQRFNTYVPDESASADEVASTRVGMIKELFGKIGEDVYIEPSLQVDYGCNITVGDRFYANFNCVILDCAHVTIGDRVMFATGVSLITATHETGLQSRRDNIEYAEPITIGDDCWIGANVTVLPGVKIGKGCTIGAGALVNRDIPDYSVAVGVPAKVVKKVDPVD